MPYIIAQKSEIFMFKSHKIWIGLICWKLPMLMQEIKNLNKWTDILHYDEKTEYSQDNNSSQPDI